MNKESVEIINRLREILQDSWINELPDNEKIAINFNKSELKLILNCISKERPAPVRKNGQWINNFGYQGFITYEYSLKNPYEKPFDFTRVKV